MPPTGPIPDPARSLWLFRIEPFIFHVSGKEDENESCITAPKAQGREHVSSMHQELIRKTTGSFSLAALHRHEPS